MSWIHPINGPACVPLDWMRGTCCCGVGPTGRIGRDFGLGISAISLGCSTWQEPHPCSFETMCQIPKITSLSRSAKCETSLAGRIVKAYQKGMPRPGPADGDGDRDSSLPSSNRPRRPSQGFNLRLCVDGGADAHWQRAHLYCSCSCCCGRRHRRSFKARPACQSRKVLSMIAGHCRRSMTQGQPGRVGGKEWRGGG